MNRRAAFIAKGELAAAVAIAFLAPQRVRLPFDVPLGVALCAIVLPFTVTAMGRYAWAWALTIIGVIAAVNGAALTGFAAGFVETDGRLLVSNTLLLLGIPLMIIALLWARLVIGSRCTALVFGIGMLVALASRGINWGNPWKFSFSVPVILIALSLVWVYGRRWPQVVMLAILAGVSAGSDARSLSGMMLVTLALVMTQGSGHRGARSMRTLTTAIRLALIVVAGYFLVQGAVLEGYLGENAKARSEAQIAQSGSLIAGGRPEMGASASLLTARPLGYGSGVLPSGSDILVAKTGMEANGYDPHNGYVNNYMFGNGFEVHSVIGDLWILFGFGGLAFAIVLGVAIGSGVIRSLASGTASAVVVFLALRSLWDLFFSPIGSAVLTLPIAVALALPRRQPAPGTAPRDRHANGAVQRGMRSLS